MPLIYDLAIQPDGDLTSQRQDMALGDFDILRALLRPLSEEEIRALLQARTGGGGRERLTLADAGLEEEVRGFLAEKARADSTDGQSNVANSSESGPPT